MNIGEELRRIEENGEIVHKHQIFFSCDFLDEGIDLLFHSFCRLGRKRDGNALRDGRDGGKKYTGGFVLTGFKISKKVDYFFHLCVEFFGCCLVMVGPDIVRSQLKEDEIRMVFSQFRFFSLEESQVLSRCVSAFTLVNDPCPDAFIPEDPIQKGGITVLCHAVAGAKDNIALGRRRAGIEKSKDQEKRSGNPRE
jgi:hypothetical protein